MGNTCGNEKCIPNFNINGCEGEEADVKVQWGTGTWK
jgi:hypothetical protein